MTKTNEKTHCSNMLAESVSKLTLENQAFILNTMSALLYAQTITNNEANK